MRRKQLLECTFFIPIRRDKHLSDGKKHSLKEWYWLRDELDKRFDTGGTIAPGLYEGTWKNLETGERVADQSRNYIIALPKEKIKDLRRLLAEACTVFHQECIYLSVAGQVEFVEAPRNDST
jgi:hypothetical protein